MAYRVEVRSLFESLSASRTVEGELSLPEVELGDQPYRFDGPATFTVTLTNTGAGIVGQGTATARVHTPCVRCLCDTTLAFDAEIEAFYVLPGHDAELPEEQEYELIASDMTVDLEPAIAQALFVELPYAPLHDAECKGICPVCGVDRNLVACSCAASGSPSPFDALKGLHLGDADGA